MISEGLHVEYMNQLGTQQRVQQPGPLAVSSKHTACRTPAGTMQHMQMCGCFTTDHPASRALSHRHKLFPPFFPASFARGCYTPSHIGCMGWLQTLNVSTPCPLPSPSPLCFPRAPSLPHAHLITNPHPSLSPCLAVGLPAKAQPLKQARVSCTGTQHLQWVPAGV